MLISSIDFDVRWADVDANQHMRHSAYYDYAAHLRVTLLISMGLNMKTLSALKVGPILFREEAIFTREISMNNAVTVNIQLKEMKLDGSRWTFVHEFIKENSLCTTVTVDGAWLDLEKRKLTSLPKQHIERMFEIPRTSDFELLN